MYLCTKIAWKFCLWIVKDKFNKILYAVLVSYVLVCIVIFPEKILAITETKYCMLCQLVMFWYICIVLFSEKNLAITVYIVILLETNSFKGV